MQTKQILSTIDLSFSGIENWQQYTPEEQFFWGEFFTLKTFDPNILTSFKYYAHKYSYYLTVQDIGRIVFCAVVEILRYHHINQMRQVFFGNSGGLDSATICALYSRAQKLAKELGASFEVISYGMPIASNPEHNNRAEETAEAFGLKHITIKGLDEAFHALKQSVEPVGQSLTFTEEEWRRGLGNIKARIRMIVNFFGTTKRGGYVVSTDNLSELYMAFWTLMGDVGAFGPIQNILKGLELPSIAYALGVPDRTLGAKPTDGLEVHTSLDDQEGGDTDAFRGVQYPHLDAIICHAAAQGLDLTVSNQVHVDASLIDSPYATQEVVDVLIAQMSSPASVWKRTKGSIGIAISRKELGLQSLVEIASLL